MTTKKQIILKVKYKERKQGIDVKIIRNPLTEDRDTIKNKDVAKQMKKY